MHKQRKIAINTPIIMRNVWRQDYIPKKKEEMRTSYFSAFVREIATVIKAGYSLEIREGMMYCMPPSDEAGEIDSDPIKLSDIDPKPNDIIKAIKETLICIFSKIEEDRGSLWSYGELYVKKYDADESSDDLDEKSKSGSEPWEVTFEFSTVKEYGIGNYLDDDNNLFTLLKIISQLADDEYLYQDNCRGNLIDFTQLNNTLSNDNNETKENKQQPSV